MTQATDATRTLVIEREVKHPPTKVWRALTESSLLEQWIFKNDFQPERGRAFTFRAEPSPYWDGIVKGEVLTSAPHTNLSYTWESAGNKFVAHWTLTPSSDGTHLRLEMTGFGPNDEQAYNGAKFGWSGMLDKLAGMLDRS